MRPPESAASVKGEPSSGGRTDAASEPTPANASPPLAPARPELGSLLPPAGWTASALALVACVGVVDYLTGSGISLVLFYLAPIGFATWYVSLRAGLALSAAAAVISIFADALHLVVTHASGLPVPVLAWNGLVQGGTSVALVLMLGALRARLEAEELLARTDALTQIANRRAFFEAAALEIERTRRTGRPITLAYVDIDDFKDVNDQRGHAEGDALLVEVARTIRSETRVIDAVARLGGDEFGLLLPETDATDADALISRLRVTLLAAMARRGWVVGFSIGAATFLAPPASIDDMMARADALMYAAKREEKGSIRHGVFEGARGVAAAP